MADHLSDSNLLERFVLGREEAAFSTLMHRHGPGVRAACRRILQSEHDTEDVVQATFLVLALKAGEVPWRDSVGGWLCGVARRLALHARAGASRRCRRETPVAGDFPEPFHPLADPFGEIDRRELRRLLDDELSLLPTKYREPVLLCDLEGLTHSEAARRLGVPSGSMSRRLERARAILRRRLKSRGLALAVVVLCGILIGIWNRGSSIGKNSTEIREAMAPFRRPDGDGLDLERFLTRINRTEPAPVLRAEAIGLARQAALVAGQIEGLDPGRNRTAWKSQAESLQRSALEMAQAASQNDIPVLRAAARRANESCVQCHLAFRQ